MRMRPAFIRRPNLVIFSSSVGSMYSAAEWPAPALQHQLVANIEGLVQRLSLVHAQQGGQLLVGPGAVVRGVVRFVDQDLGIIGHLDTGHLRQTAGCLADGIRLDAVGLGVEEHIGHLGSLFVIEEITAGLLQQTLDLVIYAGQNGDMLLGGADHAVIEGLGVNDGFHSHPAGRRSRQ